MNIDYSALTVEEMETLVKNLSEQIEAKRMSLVDGMLREMYPYVTEDSELVKGIKNLPSTMRCTSIGCMVDDFEDSYPDIISTYTEDLTLQEILVLLRIAIEMYHNNV